MLPHAFWSLNNTKRMKNEGGITCAGSIDLAELEVDGKSSVKSDAGTIRLDLNNLGDGSQLKQFIVCIPLTNNTNKSLFKSVKGYERALCI